MSLLSWRQEGARTSEKGCAALALEILHGGRRAPSPARCPALVTSTTELCWAHVVWSHRPAVRKAALVLQADVGTRLGEEGREAPRPAGREGKREEMYGEEALLP